MGKLVELSNEGHGRGKHKHIFYMPDNPQEPIIMSSEGGSKNKMHRHEVDLLNGEIGPAEDGHMHDFVGEVEFGAKPSSDSDTDILGEACKVFKTQLETEKKAFQDAKRSEEFYVGDGQWTKQAKSKLEGEERAALTFNHLQASIKTLSGFQRSNRSDFKFFPVEGGDEAVANILDVVAKVICDMNNYHQEETEWFMDAAVAGRGNLRIWEEFTQDLEMQIKMRHVDWMDVFYSSHRRKDCEDLKCMTVSKWLTRDELKALYPDKEKDIDDFVHLVDDIDDYMRDEPHLQVHGQQYALKVGNDVDLYDKHDKKFRLMEMWRREDIKRKIAFHPLYEESFPVDDYADNYKSHILSLPGFEFVTVAGHRMRLTEFAGDILLSDEYPDVPDQDFPVIALYCDKTRDYFWSKIHVGKDAQCEINKRLSQFIDILNRYAVYCMLYKENLFNDAGEEANFKRNATKAGGIYRMSPEANPGEDLFRIEGAKVPVEIISAQKEMLFQLRELMNVNPEMLGSVMQKSESGVAQRQKVDYAMMGNRFLFDNLDMAKRKLGKKLVKYIQSVYKDNPEGILEMLGTEAMRREVKLAGEAYDPQNSQMRMAVMQLLNDSDLTKYDIAVEESAESPTIRMNIFMTLSELARNGYPVPPAMLIDIMPGLPRDMKDEMLQMVQQQQQQQAEADKMPYETEILKSQIAAQGQAGGPPQAPQQMPPQGMMPQ